jgi:hypothetical protein
MRIAVFHGVQSSLLSGTRRHQNPPLVAWGYLEYAILMTADVAQLFALTSPNVGADTSAAGSGIPVQIVN